MKIRQSYPRLWQSAGRLTFIVGLVFVLAGCGGLPSLPQAPDLSNVPVPDLSQLPEVGELPSGLEQVPELFNQVDWNALQLPDLSGIAGLPQLEDLPLRAAPPGGIVFNGPTERRLRAGDRIPGTDIRLLSVDENGAEFAIAGLRSRRLIGDSLDYDGAWAGAAGVEYNLRMRLYRVGDNAVRAAGVHQFVIPDIQPIETGQTVDEQTVRLPVTLSTSTGSTFPGLTFGYGGSDERGAIITGLPQDEYPYRKVGDSLTWRGTLRADIPAEYGVRMLPYTDSRGQLGGIVKLRLPE